MRPDIVVREWENAFGEVAPLGHLCRAAFPERWLRVHNLPDAKRYADSAEEYQELLARQNTVATAVLGITAECVLFFCEFPNESASVVLELFAVSLQQYIWLPELATRAVGYEQIRIGAAFVSWRPGDFDDLLRARADDKVGLVLLANLNRQTAFAPYDGGADLFLNSAETAVACRRDWSAWLSPRADGL
jgi:hypothetical protein